MLGDRLGHADGVFAVQVGQQLHAEADVALLVGGDVLHALAERRQLVALFEVAADEVLARLGERRLDHDVVERHRRGELGGGAVGAQLVGHPCPGGRRSCETRASAAA